VYRTADISAPSTVRYKNLNRNVLQTDASCDITDFIFIFVSLYGVGQKVFTQSIKTRWFLLSQFSKLSNINCERLKSW